MKIAVISDIHGNMEALSAVLKDIENENAEKLFICGDLAMAGPEPAKTIDFIRKLASEKDVTIIQGNTDKMIVEASDESIEKLSKASKVMANALKYASATLSEDQKQYLADLPAQKSQNIEGISVLLVHGSPRRNNEDILPEQPVEKIEEIIAGTSEDLIFCGHTHLPAGYQAKNQTVVNVGSVGRPFTQEPQACYVIFEVKNKSFGIKHKFIDYDRQSASERLRKLGFEGSDKLADMLLQPTTRYPQ